MRPLGLAAIALLSSCATSRAPHIEPSEVASSTSLPTPEYFEAVTSLHLYLVRSAELATRLSANTFHRDYARQMHREHKRILDRLAGAGRRFRLQRPAALHPAHQRWLDELENAKEPILFDATYPRNQMLAHGVAQRLHGAYALYGERPELRGLAARLMRTAEEHERLMRMRPTWAIPTR